jgi:hypothetical protein
MTSTAATAMATTMPPMSNAPPRRETRGPALGAGANGVAAGVASGSGSGSGVSVVVRSAGSSGSRSPASGSSSRATPCAHARPAVEPSMKARVVAASSGSCWPSSQSEISWRRSAGSPPGPGLSVSSAS